MNTKLFERIISCMLGLVIMAGLAGCASISNWRADRYYQNGLDLEKQSKTDEALVSYTKAISLNPNLEPAYFKRGMIYFNQNSLDQANADLEQEVALNPQNAEAFYRLGLIALKKGDLVKAHDNFSQAISLNYPDVDVSYQLGLIHAGVPPNPKIDINQALVDFSRAIQGGMQTADVFYQRGLILAGKKIYDKAIADFSQAVKLDPKMVGAYYEQGLAYQDIGQPDLAFASFGKVIELDAKNVDAFYRHGIYQVQKGRLDEAIKDLDQVIQLDANNVDAFFQRGRAYGFKGEMDKAILDYNQVVALNPDYPRIYIERSQALFTKGDYPAAIADLDKVIKDNPNEVLYLAQRGFANFQVKDFDNAILDYLAQTKMSPNSAKAFFNLGLAYARKGDWASAINSLDQAIKLNPTANAYRARGDIDFQMRDLKSALQDHQKALNLDSKLTGLYLQMSQEAFALGYLQDSIQYAYKSLNGVPDAKNAAEIKDWIASLETEMSGKPALNLAGMLPGAADVPPDCVPYPEGKAWLEKNVKQTYAEANANIIYVGTADFYCSGSKQEMAFVIYDIASTEAQAYFVDDLENALTVFKADDTTKLITDSQPGEVSFGFWHAYPDQNFGYMGFKQGIVGVLVMTWNSTDAPALKFEDLIHLMNERAVTGLLSTMPFNQLTNDLEAIQPIN